MFGSIVNEGYLNSPSESEEFCVYNRNPNACGYGVTVGVLTFLTCLLYLALDVYFPQISSVKDRKKAVLSDIGVSGEPPAQAPPPPPWHSGVGRGLSRVVPLVRILTHTCQAAPALLPIFQMRKLRCRRVKGQTWGHKAGSREGRAQRWARDPRTAHGSWRGGEHNAHVTSPFSGVLWPLPWWSPVRTKQAVAEGPGTQ